MAISPAHRHLVLKHLPPDLRLALPSLEEALDLPPGQVWSVPALSRVLETAAVARLAEEFREREGLSLTVAMEEAEFVLGIEEGTAARRLRRWRCKARVHEDAI